MNTRGSAFAEAGGLPRRSLIPVSTASLVAFAAAALGAGIARAVTTTYLPVLLHDVREAPGLIGTVMLVNPIAGFFAPLVIGLWSDRRRGRRLPFIAGGSVVTAGGLVAIALGVGTSYALLAAAGALTYVGINAVTTAHRALVPVSFSPDLRPRATSAQEVALLVGSLVGVAAGGPLLELASWSPFVVAAAAVPLLTLPTLLRVTDRGTEAAAARRMQAVRYYAQAALQPGVRALLLAQTLWVLGYAALPTFFILYARRVLGIEPAIAALWLAAFGALAGAATLAGGRVRDPNRQAPLITLGVALMGMSFLAAALSTTTTLVAAALVPAACGFGLVSALGFPLLTTMIPRGEEGAYSALYFSVRAVSAAVALPAVGWTIALTGSFRTLFAFGGLATLAAVVPLARASWLAIEEPTRTAITRRLPARGWWMRWLAALGALYAGVLGLGLLVSSTRLRELDERLFRRMNDALGPGPDFLWYTLNPPLRNYAALALVAVVAACRGRALSVRRVLLIVGIAGLFAWGLLEAVYLAWDRPRPEEIFGREHIRLTAGHSFARIESYPSGHMAIIGALVSAIGALFPRLRRPLWAYGVVAAFARVVTGAHFPVDAIGGLALGYGSARLVLALLAKTRSLT